MAHKCLALMMAVMLSQLLGAVVFCAQTYTEDSAQAIERIKSKVARMGNGEKARVTVRLKSGQKLKGYIAQAQEHNFVLRDRKTDAPTEIAYSDVAKVEDNRGHSSARNLAIGIGAGVGAVLLLAVIVATHLD